MCVCVCFCIHVYIDIFLCFVGYLIHISLSGLANWFSAAIVYSDCTTRFYMTIHFLWRRFIGSGFKTARTASSNTWMKQTIMVSFCFQQKIKWSRTSFMLMRYFIAIRNDNTQKLWINNKSFECDVRSHKYVRCCQTCFSPRCVSAEHSIYFTALILLANFWPCSRFNGDKPCSDKALNVSLSSLKSILVPIKRKHIRNEKI